MNENDRAVEHTTGKYIVEHSSPQEPALAWIEQQTNIHTNYPQMLSGPVIGRFLRMLIQFTGARRILEIGTFTGYSAAAMALGLPSDGHIDSLEINDELVDLIKEGWRRAGVEEKITLISGDALESLQSLAKGPQYDIAFIDANKRDYLQYYEAVKPLVRHGGIIIADDTLMGGKVTEGATDAQTRGLAAFNDAVAKDEEVEKIILPLPDGMSIIRVP